MVSQEVEEPVGWMENGVPKRTDRLTFLVMIIAGTTFGVVIYLTGLAQGRILVPFLFAALLGGAYAIGTYGNRRRRPTRVGVSVHGVVVDFSGRKTRFIEWDEIGDMRIRQFVGDTTVDILYRTGKWEEDIHIYGEAARELKRRFEERRASSAS